MGHPARHGERPAYDRDSLLEVAVAVFNERGYDGTGMEELARRLGLSKSSIYHHVAGKEELLSLAVTRALDALFAVLDEGPAPYTSATALLRHVVRRSVEVLASELPYVTLLLRVHGNSDTERRALARRREFDHRVADLVVRAAAEGGVRDDMIVTTAIPWRAAPPQWMVRPLTRNAIAVPTPTDPVTTP
ncbi:TetR/AcrR family transcriptional regulator [Streptomyces sp. NBC_00841]|uniref:TetR/AcrR family transcriptional regulator n=1 Tax=unclassified Streptomyces TaxID=2593676 RepID=UPI0022529073|nr:MULTISPECIES: TetR/AcrR family transcriptional regulator [unclassified Streptomyces]MCX4532083.1 TetR/AcrR family transcriptional regulator [Streptomyces sp. NBC_01669]WSA04580.1 TetR/AcrR family transcriptional regulator [Streptomyces sp. NBC_00841]